MALTDTTTVRLLGGLNEATAYLQFRMADDTELEAFVQAQIDVAAAWLSLTSTYYTSVVPAIQAVHAQAEAYIALQYIFDSLKPRKVLGTHFPYDTEESSSFQQMIDVEWEARAETLLSRFTTLDTAARPIAFPVFSVGPAIDYTNVDSAEAELTEIRDQSLGYNPATPR